MYPIKKDKRSITAEHTNKHSTMKKNKQHNLYDTTVQFTCRTTHQFSKMYRDGRMEG